MNYSKEWEDTYQAHGHIASWPWSDLVSYVARYARPAEDFKSVLEIGCGTGPNIPFFLQRGFEYRAIEGSASAVEHVHRLFPKLVNDVVVGDFTRVIPFMGPFDLIVDRVSIPHNTTEAIRRTLAMIYDRLRPGGKFIGIDWFSVEHEDSRKGEKVDSHTRRDIKSRSLNGLGEVHFFDRDHLIDLLQGQNFTVERLEQKRSEIFIPWEEGELAWWHFVAVKE